MPVNSIGTSGKNVRGKTGGNQEVGKEAIGTPGEKKKKESYFLLRGESMGGAGRKKEPYLDSGLCFWVGRREGPVSGCSKGGWGSGKKGLHDKKFVGRAKRDPSKVRALWETRPAALAGTG